MSPGVFHEELARQPAQQHDADHPMRGAAGVVEVGQRHDGNARVQHPGQAHVGRERWLQQHADVRQRPGEEPGEGVARRDIGERSHQQDQACAEQVAPQVGFAAMQPGGCPPAPQGLVASLVRSQHQPGRQLGPELRRQGQGHGGERQAGQGQQQAERTPPHHVGRDRGTGTLRAQGRGRGSGAPVPAGERCPNTDCHKASTASRWCATAVSRSPSSSVGASSRRARCWMRRSSR